MKLLTIVDDLVINQTFWIIKIKLTTLSPQTPGQHGDNSELMLK